MLGVCWHGAYDVRVADDLSPPDLVQSTDALVRVTRSAICGTDLHPYRGEIPNFLPATIMGHEFTGVVEEVGRDVHSVRRGDRVVASDVVACGSCWYCQRGWHYQCTQVTLFGYGTVIGPYLPGGQAEYVRIPFANHVLATIPYALEDEQALFVSDILTTGFTCAAEAQIRAGDTVAVVGCGPVGLFAIQSAYLLGAARVLALDPAPSRRVMASQLGGYPIIPDEQVSERVREITAGRGADIVLEAVGSDRALSTALAIVRPRGVISIVGAHSSHAMPFSTLQAFAKEVTLRFVVGDPIRMRHQLFPLLETGRIDATSIISHRLPLREARQGYRLFDQLEATKVVFLP